MTSKILDFVHTAVVLALLLCSQAAGQVSQCAPAAAPQLRFVAQLSVSGCTLFVHDTGASDGPHLAVEPLMCVTDSLEGLLPRLDPVTQQLYVSVPVVMRDSDMLAEAERRLRHLSPRSVSFATVTNITVSAHSDSFIKVVGFLWTPAESVAYLRLGYKVNSESDTINQSKHAWLPTFPSKQLVHSLEKQMLYVSKLAANAGRSLSRIRLSASIISNGTCHRVQGNPVLQNDSFFNLELNRKGYEEPTSYKKLRFIRYINLENCTARVHQRLDIKGHFLIEPLLCHNITSLSSESVRYDCSRDMHYLKLDLVLQDEATLDAVRTQLSDLSPRSVEFMRLWLAEMSVSSALSARFEIGPLMVSADWRSAQLHLFCRTSEQCLGLRLSLQSEPADIWRHLEWRAQYLTSGQFWVQSHGIISSWRMKPSKNSASCSSLKSCIKLCCSNHCNRSPIGLIQVRQGRRCFISIQQRRTGRVSFQRNWTEYETGFGDDSDFWIGLSAIHSLSAGGATLRVEMKLWNGTELHAEYAGFQVGDASTKYVMTYREMLRDRSSVGYNALDYHKGMRFSTMDIDNDKTRGSCSNIWGKGGWWFKTCHHVNPNGLFPSGESNSERCMGWKMRSGYKTLRSVRLMLQI